LATLSDKFLLMFVPESLNSVSKFSMFLGHPFLRTHGLLDALNTCKGHFQKTEVLIKLATKLLSGLDKDNIQLESNGYTPAIGHHEFAAIIECTICELYAVLDGVRAAIYYIYKDKKGIQNQSTQKMFARAINGGYDSEDIPATIINALAYAKNSWFDRHAQFRTELTHGNVGSCSKNRNGKIAYFNEGLGTRFNSFVSEDIIAELNVIFEGVFCLQDNIFSFLYNSLSLNEQKVPCGIYRGRCFMRRVYNYPDLSNDSGFCESASWFEDDLKYACPIKDNCLAYKRSKIL
jgi:hypothetical protein